MMRKFYIASTTSFWIAIAAFWLFGVTAPKSAAETQAAAKKLFSLAEVASHGAPNDCWMAIRGKVYDLTAYLPDHPSRPEIVEKWCGKEASDAYETKTKGRAHSPDADRLLESYLIGDLK
jgi:cytochrome b involved in lipid metabolism